VLLTKSARLADSSSATTTTIEESISRSGGAIGSSAGCPGPAKAFHVHPIGILKLNCGIFAKIGRTLAAKSATKVDNAAKAVEDFLGGEGKIIKNADGDAILMKGDKKIRFDVNDPHGDAPHFHLEQQTPSGKWKDAGPEHRYYFEEK